MPGADDGDSDWPLPVLLRVAWRTYVALVRDALAAAGFDDMPRNGASVVGGIARAGAPLSEIVERLGVSKQSAGQLVDTLVARGYLERAVDPRDRRRLHLTLTERGRAAAAVVSAVVEARGDELERRLGAERLAHTRATLAAIIGPRAVGSPPSAGPPGPAGTP